MKAITIQQPWAWAIIAGHKRVENRTWPTRHRGPLAIHAGLSRASEKEGQRILAELEIKVPKDLVYGAILGVVDLVDCIRSTVQQPSLFDPPQLHDSMITGPWCWLLESPQAFRVPVACQGYQGIWDSSKRCLCHYAHPIVS